MSHNQESVFQSFEANNWLKRNLEYMINKKSRDDKIYAYLSSRLEIIQNKSVLEVGSSIGFRLKWLKDDFNCKVCGVDPSSEAIMKGRNHYDFHEHELLDVDNFENIWIENFLSKRFGVNSFDVIIFGHCLYLTSPEQLSSLVSESLKLLKTGGIIVIYDFDSAPQRQPYHHLDSSYGVFSYKMNFADLYNCYPNIRLVYKEVFSQGEEDNLGNPKEDCALSVLKCIERRYAYPEISTDVTA